MTSPPHLTNDQDDRVSLDALTVYLTESALRDADKHHTLRAKALKLLAKASATAVPYVSMMPNVIVIVRLPLASSTVRDVQQAVESGVPIVSLQWLEDCVSKGYVIPHANYQVPDWSSPTGNASTSINSSQTPRASQVEVTSSIFQGCRISMGALYLRDEKQCSGFALLLEQGRANILHHDSSGRVVNGVPTHVVCPPDIRKFERTVIDGVKKANVKALTVTPFWVTSSISANRMLLVSDCILFSPLSYPVPFSDFKMNNVRICFSGYPPEKQKGQAWNSRFDVLSRLTKLLGAEWSKRMRRTCTTHVVVRKVTQMTEKSQMAQEWNIPVVTDDWLLACAGTGKLVGVEGYTPTYVSDEDNDQELTQTSQGKNRPKLSAHFDVDVDEDMEVQPSRSATRTTPRRSPRHRRERVERSARSDITDEAAINLLQRFSARLDEGTNNCDRDAGVDQDEDNGECARRRSVRSRSDSRDLSRSDWSMDASQSQVIVHRELTPPPTPRSKARSLPPRAVKRQRRS